MFESQISLTHLQTQDSVNGFILHSTPVNLHWAFLKISVRTTFWCFSFLSEVLFMNMDDTTTLLLRKSFQGVYSMCFLSFTKSVLLQESQSVFVHCSVSNNLHLYEKSHKYKKSATFCYPLRCIHAKKLSIKIFQICNCLRAVIFLAILH